MTTPLQINRYDRILRKLGNLVGEGAIVTGALPDVFPGIDLENLQPDSWFYAGWDIAQGSEAINALGGERPELFLENPTGSNKICVVTGLNIFSDTQQEIRFGVGPTPGLTPSTANQYRDTRRGPAISPVCFASGRSSAGALPLQSGRFFTAAPDERNQTVPDGLAVLTPGFSFNLFGLALGSGVDVTFYWRERAAEASEV